MRASETARALLCPASLIRKKTGQRSDKANKTAAWGTFVHKWKETGETGNNKTLLKKLQRSGIDREKLWPEVSNSYGHEATFSIDIESLCLRIWSSKGSK